MVRLQTRCHTSDHFSRSTVLFPILLTLWLLSHADAVTHWVVTERGRIQASRDSAFALRRPYDLAAVFQQMERANDMRNVRDHLRELQPKEGVQLDETDIWSLQKEVMESDENCKAAGKPVYEFDFYTSTVLPLSHFGLKLEDHINIHQALDMPSTSKVVTTAGRGGAAVAHNYQEPRCWIHKLDFSMHSLEHLSSIRNRRKIPAVAETALRSVVVPQGMTIDQFGHAIQQTLKRNSESWVAYSMASFYWRMKGNASAAIECIRRALHHAPRRYKSEPLLNLGNILHRNGQSEDAAIVVQWALDLSPGLSVLHFTLANILASLERDDEASRHYEASLQLQPRLVASAQLRLHAVKCRQALVAALNRQAKEWESALAMLRSKQARLMALQRTISKMREEQSPDEFSQIQELIYQNWLENERKRGTITYCQNGDIDEPVSKLKCPSYFLPTDHQPFWADRLESRLGIGRYADKPEQQPTQPPMDGRIPYQYGTKIERPGIRMLYTSWSVHDKKLFFEDLDWPSEEQCKSARIPKWTDFEPVLVPPINKGFNFSSFFLTDEKSFSDEPVCLSTLHKQNNSDTVYNGGGLATSEWLISRYLASEELDDVESQSPGPTDVHLQKELLAAVGCNQSCVKAAGGNSILSTMMDRLGHLLAQELAVSSQPDKRSAEVEANSPYPLWLVETLAISYWHSLGQVGRAVDCAHAALRDVPLRYRDMPLTAIAGLLYRLSAVEEATDAIAEALAAAPFEPEPNYFMGSMLAVKGDLLGAMSHFAKALRQRSSLKAAEKHLLPLACHQRQKAFSVTDKQKQFESSSSSCSSGDNSQGADKSQSGHPSFDFLDGTMTLLESRTNSGKVVDLYVRTTTAKPPSSEENTSESNSSGGEREISGSAEKTDQVTQQFVVEYSDSSIPYARLSVSGDRKLTAEPHLMTTPPPTDEAASRIEICLVFANGTLSSSCSSEKAFAPFLASINSLAKHFADTLQPGVDYRRNFFSLQCGEKICGQAVGDHFSAIPTNDYPRSPATISKFIATVVKQLANRTTNAARLKPTSSDPVAIHVPQQLVMSDELENRIRLMLAVRRSLSQRSDMGIYSTSSTACHANNAPLSHVDKFPLEVSSQSGHLPDPLSTVPEGHLEQLLERLNPECHMPGVVLTSSSSREAITHNGKSVRSLLAEPFCECDPPYHRPNQKTSAESAGQRNNFSTSFLFSSVSDLHYTPETHLQPWAAQLQSSLKLDSSRQLAAVLASHLHHSSRSNVCSDDAHGWLPLTLAARYWRLRGNAAEATRCLSAAVASSFSHSHMAAGATAVPLLELSDFLRHLGYLPHSLVAAASTLVFPNQSAAAAAASRLGAIFAQMERLDAAVIFYELAASAAAAFVAASTANESTTAEAEPPPVENFPPKRTQAVASTPNAHEQANILLRLHITSCQRDRRYRRAAMLLRRLVRGSSSPMSAPSS